MATEEHWRTPNFRQSIVAKIDEAIQRSGMPTAKKGIEMESHVFQKAKTKEEYLGFVARLILHVRELNSKKNNVSGPTGQNMQDPINALQTLARQGTGNQNMMQLPPPQMNQQQPNPNMADNSNLFSVMPGMNPRPVMQQKMQPGSQLDGMLQVGGGGVLGALAGGGMIGSPGPGPGPNVPQMGPNPGPPQPPPPPQMQQRKPDGGMMMGPAGYPMPGPRAPQFHHQSPTQPNHSPQIPTPNMVPSPALVPSPGNPQLGPNMQGGIRSVGMVSSPGSCLNTPGQPVATSSPCGMNDDAAYREKIRQLSKYIEPLRRMISRVGVDDHKNMNKMKTLLDILTNPNKRMPLETLIKCEVVLEKMDLKRGEGGATGPTTTTMREQHPLIEAVRQHLQSPVINHTLQRTFGPCVDALLGSDIKVPSPVKRKRTEDLHADDIPEVLQGEIARLDQRFKVSLDPMQQQYPAGGKCVQLVCWLDDKHLPCVPPVSLTVPDDYPATPPKYHLGALEHSATGFLSQVQAALHSRVSKLPSKFTVSQLLDTWEMSVRQACAPPHRNESVCQASPVLLGL